MALIKCHECGKDVSTEATACPNCGAKVRTPKRIHRKLSMIEKAGVVVVALMILAWIISPDKPASDTNIPAPAPKQQTAQDDAACKKDLQCWGDKNIAAVGVYCKDSIEGLAKYSVKWTDGTFETKFSRFSWLNKNKGTLKYYGDKAQFQNGFGAYQNVVYECDFDPSDNKVLRVTAEPGHL